MKLSDIVYPLTRPHVIWAVSVYLKKIFYSNCHRLPVDRPLMIVSNHPTAFLEPVVYSGLLKKPIHSLVRGDFFQNKMARVGLESLNMVEIYRMKDGGREGVRKNAQTFQYCYDLIARGEQVLIMAEGFTTQQKRLGPLQAGAARMALGAATSKNLDNMVIVPIGANFTQANIFRSELMVEVGQPIEVSEFLPSYKLNKKQSINQLTEAMAEAMKKTLIHIDDPMDDALFERVVPILRRCESYSLWPDWILSDDRFKLEKSLANYINKANDEDKSKLIELADGYPLGVAERPYYPLLSVLVLVLAFPQWIIGKVYSWLPFAYPRSIVKNKVKVREFESPIRFGFGALGIIIWTILWIAVVGLFVDWRDAWIPFAMLFVVWVSFIYDDICTRCWGGLQWSRLSRSEKAAAVAIEQKVLSIIGN